MSVLAQQRRAQVLHDEHRAVKVVEADVVLEQRPREHGGGEEDTPLEVPPAEAVLEQRLVGKRFGESLNDGDECEGDLVEKDLLQEALDAEGAAEEVPDLRRRTPIKS